MTNSADVFAPEKLLKAWLPFRAELGVASVRTKRDYEKASKVMFQLLDLIGEDETHPLCGVLDYVTAQIMEYEDEHVHIPDADPVDVLKFLMEERNLKQSDLADCLPPSRISEILNGKRKISKNIAKILAQKFKVHADVFI